MDNQHSGYADRVLRLLEHVEYRRAESEKDRRAIYRLRHDAYMRAGTVPPQPSRLFHDPFDETPNAWLIGLYIDGDLASALRLNISASPTAPLPAMTTFGDIVEPHLQSGRTIIDATRFVSKLEYSQRYSEMPYITLRPAFLAEEYFDADYITAACLVEHQAFYRRMFGGVPWSQPREYPHFTRRMAFLGYDCRAFRQATRNRYPFYRSTEAERAAPFLSIVECDRRRAAGHWSAGRNSIERRLGGWRRTAGPTRAKDRPRTSAFGACPSTIPARDRHKR